MKKRYTLPAVTAEGQDTSIEVLIDDDAKLRKWLYSIIRYMVIDNFKFRWAVHPRSIAFPFSGKFAVVYSRDGIYIDERLYYTEYYRDVRYSLEEFCRMIFKSTRPSLGWRITVKV